MRRRDFLATASAAGGAAWLAGHMPQGVLDGLAPEAAADPLVYVGTYTENGRTDGIFRFRVDAGTGMWKAAGATDAGTNPSFLALHPRGTVLYAVNESEQYEGAASGAVSAFAIDRATGALTLLGRQSSHGGSPAYVSVDPAGHVALVANYGGGSVAAFPLAADGALGAAAQVVQHTGSGPRKDRQEKAHAHSIVPDPSGRFALSADLGTDQIFVYRLGDATTPLRPAAMPFIAARPGAGPRHLAFHPAGRLVYATDELDLTVTAYRFDPATGALAALQTVPLVDAGPGERTAADLHVAPSGRFVYASVRGDNVLVVLGIDPAAGTLRVVQRISTGGNWPRNFALDPSGRFLYAANQRSNSIVGFRVDPSTGRLTPSGMQLEVPAPVCIRFAASA